MILGCNRRSIAVHNPLTAFISSFIDAFLAHKPLFAGVTIISPKFVECLAFPIGENPEISIPDGQNVQGITNRLSKNGSLPILVIPRAVIEVGMHLAIISQIRWRCVFLRLAVCKLDPSPPGCRSSISIPEASHISLKYFNLIFLAPPVAYGHF